MSTDSKKVTPAVLLVHGAWHTPDPHYKRFTDALEALGFVVSAPRLPSVSGERPPTTTFADDLNCVREEAKKLAEAGHPILVVGHSYGGVVSTEAFTEDLTLKSRQAAGKKGGVARLVFLTAFIPQIGENIRHILMTTKSEQKSALIFSPDEDGLTLPSNPEAFYNDMSQEKIDEFSKSLVMHPIIPQTGKATHLAWKIIPNSYIYCTDDLALPYDTQKEMVEMVRAQGIEVQEETLTGASHSPFESQTDNTVACMQRIWEATAPSVTVGA